MPPKYSKQIHARKVDYKEKPLDNVALFRKFSATQVAVVDYQKQCLLGRKYLVVHRFG